MATALSLHHRRPLPRWGVVIGAAFLFAVLSAGAYLVSGAWAIALQGSVPAELLLIPLILGAKLLVDLLAARANAPFLPVATSVGALLAAPVLGWSMVRGLREQLASLESYQGSPLPILLFPLLAISTSVTALFLASVSTKRLFRASLPVMSVCALGLPVLTFLSGRRTIPHVGLDQYTAGLETRTLSTPAIERHDMVPGGSPTVQLHGYPPGMTLRTFYERGPDGVKRTDIEDLTVIQKCEGAGCELGVIHRGAELTAEDPLFRAPALESSGKITMRYQREAKVVLFPDCCASWVELEEANGHYLPEQFSTARMLSRVGPPISGVVTAAIGVLLVLAVCMRRRRAVRSLHALSLAVPGTLGADGWIALPDGRGMRFDDRLPIEPGPVLVLGQAIPDTAYRDRQVLPAEMVIPGSLAEHQEAGALRILHVDLAACAIACLASAPLVGAILVGLV